jgi:hypothetical protein
VKTAELPKGDSYGSYSNCEEKRNLSVPQKFKFYSDIFLTVAAVVVYLNCIGQSMLPLFLNA